MAKKEVVEKENVTEGDADVKESVKKNENRQALWFFVIVIILFASFFVPYFYMGSLKSFEYVGADWRIEDYENLRIYHGRFAALDGSNLNYNIYLRGDPRKNDVAVEGNFDMFKHGGIVSISPEVDECRGEISRAMIDLGAFLREGVGVGALEVASTDKFVAVENERLYATCEIVADRTLVVVDRGDESKITQDEKNLYCYTIYIDDCNDISSVEKFLIETLDDFGGKK